MPDSIEQRDVLDSPPPETDSSNQIPGWQLVDPKDGGTYTIDPQFLGQGHRIFQVMPVECDFPVMTGVDILGLPRVIAHEESAANPRNMTLPTIDQLRNVAFYHGTIMPQVLSSDWHRQALGDNLAQRLSQDCVGPIEIHPFATNVFVFPSLQANFTYAVQPLGQKNDQKLCLFHAPVRPFRNSQIDIGSRLTEGPIHGVAYVTHLRIPVDLSKYFETSLEIQDFNGTISRSSSALALFDSLMRNHLESIGNEVAEQRRMPVKGVVLSPISVNYRYNDSISSISPNPQGELLVAATYLV